MEKVVELDFLDLLYVKFSNLNFIYEVKKFQLFCGEKLQGKKSIEPFSFYKIFLANVTFCIEDSIFFNFQNILCANFFLCFQTFCFCW